MVSDVGYSHNISRFSVNARQRAMSAEAEYIVWSGLRQGQSYSHKQSKRAESVWGASAKGKWWLGGGGWRSANAMQT